MFFYVTDDLLFCIELHFKFHENHKLESEKM